MATLLISLFGNVDKECAGSPLGTVSLSTSGTSAATSALNVRAVVAAFYSDTAHYVAIGGDGDTLTASASNGFYLPASTLYWQRFYVATGQAVKVSAVTA